MSAQANVAASEVGDLEAASGRSAVSESQAGAVQPRWTKIVGSLGFRLVGRSQDKRFRETDPSFLSALQSGRAARDSMVCSFSKLQVALWELAEAAGRLPPYRDGTPVPQGEPGLPARIRMLLEVGGPLAGHKRTIHHAMRPFDGLDGSMLIVHGFVEARKLRGGAVRFRFALNRDCRDFLLPELLAEADRFERFTIAAVDGLQTIQRQIEAPAALT